MASGYFMIFHDFKHKNRNFQDVYILDNVCVTEYAYYEIYMKNMKLGISQKSTCSLINEKIAKSVNHFIVNAYR